MAAKFHVYRDGKGEYRWRLSSGNGQVIANGGVGDYKVYQGEQPRSLQRGKIALGGERDGQLIPVIGRIAGLPEGGGEGCIFGAARTGGGGDSPAGVGRRARRAARGGA